jgi:hypothetical protein
MEGRFSQLLPTKVPDENMRALAMAMLKVKGAYPSLAAKPQGRPRFRQ